MDWVKNEVLARMGVRGRSGVTEAGVGGFLGVVESCSCLIACSGVAGGLRILSSLL